MKYGHPFDYPGLGKYLYPAEFGDRAVTYDTFYDVIEKNFGTEWFSTYTV